ncbi:Major facilitator superfamily [Trinorchestia longiramus]|nr:Major facilitator superfamily [Trinorchestia longiramus]
MNLAFSSAILVLAQYFDKRHSLATTIAMLGNGIGVLILSQVIEKVITAYGWRISFLLCAAISLQLCVVGALFFPLPPSALQQENFEKEQHEGDVPDGTRHSSEDESSSSEDEDRKKSIRRLEKKHGGGHRRHIDHHNNLYYRKELLDKSFSSLVLCPQAGYLSHSLASLEPPSPSPHTCAPRHHHHHTDCEAGDYGRHCRPTRSRRRLLHDAELKRNESLASRDSSFLPAFFKRSQLSFSSKLSSAQISLAGFQSSQQSRISLKDSRLDLMFHGLKSNPHSFSLRTPTSTQLEETEQLCAKLDDLLEEKSSSEDGSKEKLSERDSKQCSLQIKCEKSEKGKEFCFTNPQDTLKQNIDLSTGLNVDYHHAEKGMEKKASFLISGGESDEDDDDAASCTSEIKSHPKDHETLQSKFVRWLQDMRMTCCSRRSVFGVHDLLFSEDPSVWCFAFSYFCSQLGATTIFVIFADFAQYLGVGDYASTAMSAAGFGDIVGRFGGGMLAVGGVGNSTVLYACFMLMSALLLCSYLIVNNGIVFVGVTAAYGTMYGAQNMYFAITAKIIFGRQCLADVFGLAVFLGGIGSLVGSPLAGLLIDVSGGYISVLLSEVTCCVLGGVLMFVCFLSKRNEYVDELSTLDSQHSSESLVPSDSRLPKTGDKDGNLNCSYINTNETNKKRRGSDLSRDFCAQQRRCASLASPHLMSNSSSRSSVADDDVFVKIPQFIKRTGRHPKNMVDSRGSLASLPVRASLHPSHRSHALRSTNSLKRTSTCDSILHGVPTHSPMPASNVNERNRRFTMSSPRQYNHKKKSPSLYEEVLGRTYAQGHNVCYSDHDLS